MFWEFQIILVRLFCSRLHFLKGMITFPLRIDLSLSSSSIGINGVLIILINTSRLIPTERVYMTLVHHCAAQKLRTFEIRCTLSLREFINSTTAMY